MTASTNSKTAILDRLKSRPVDSLPLPALDASKLTRWDDPVTKFVEMLSAVGGDAHFIERPEEAKQVLESTAVFTDAKLIASLGQLC